MNGPARKEWWAKRASGHGERQKSRNMFQWEGQAYFDEVSICNKEDIYLVRALQDMAIKGNATAIGICGMRNAERNKFFLHVRLTKFRMPFIDTLLAKALALRMGAGNDLHDK